MSDIINACPRRKTTLDLTVYACGELLQFNADLSRRIMPASELINLQMVDSGMATQIIQAYLAKMFENDR